MVKKDPCFAYLKPAFKVEHRSEEIVAFSFMEDGSSSLIGFMTTDSNTTQFHSDNRYRKVHRNFSNHSCSVIPSALHPFVQYVPYTLVFHVYGVCR